MSTATSAWKAVGQIGGPTQAVAIQGQYAYVGVGLRLIVLDMANPATPIEIGATAPFPDFVEDIAVSETTAYVAAGGAGLRVVDVSDPAHPVEAGAWDSPGYAEGVTVAGSIAYLADGPYGLGIVDVSSPADPAPLAKAYEMNYGLEVVVLDHYAYMAAAGAGLLVADVSDPAHPVEVGSLDTPGYAYDVAAAGNTVFVADAWEGLRVVDVSSPGNPTTIGAYVTPGWAMSVAMAGSEVYVADGANGLRLVDVSDRANPQEIGAFQEPGLARRVAVAGSTAYVADLREGLRVLDVTDPAHPTQVGSYSPLADARRVAVAGSYVYVAAGFSGLRVVDVSDPAHPREVGGYDTQGGYAVSVLVSGAYAYLAANNSVHVLNISDPTHPVRTGFISTWGAYREIALQGSTVYVADETGLRLISVSDPTSPAQLSSIRLDENQQSTVGVAVAGSLAYLADALDGVKLVDVSNPVSPIVVGVYDSPGLSQGVTVVGNRAYVADSQAGLRIVDVSEPGIPAEMGFYDTPGVAESVTIGGSLAYVSVGGEGVQIVDVLNPQTPTLVAAYDTPGFAWHTQLGGDYLYVADGHGGLLVWEKATANRSVDVANVRSESDHDDPPMAEDTGSESITHVVRSVADSGPGTLRQAILDAGPGDTITFDPAIFPPTTPATISPQSQLPPINQGGITIDGSNTGVILEGNTTPVGSVGLLIDSSYNTIKGLQILRFPNEGIKLNWGTGNNTIGGDRTVGSGPSGEGNVLSGNGEWSGIRVESSDNVIEGNLIGTNATGQAALGNEWTGITLTAGGKRNRVGGSTVGRRNIISANEVGIYVENSGTSQNVIAGNFIGTDASGTSALGNQIGIALLGGATDNQIGGPTSAEKNVIAGNLGDGIAIRDTGTDNNVVIGNQIGAPADGLTALGNQGNGVLVWSGAARNRIGGLEPGEGNVIGGNSEWGIRIWMSGTGHNEVVGNFIGTDEQGTVSLPNTRGGIGMHDGTQGNLVGPANRIAHNGGDGVTIDGSNTSGNTVTTNAIHDNVGKGIANVNGANQSLPPPDLSGVTATTVTGSAAPGMVIEVFSDGSNEGEAYEGRVTVGPSGVFTFVQTAGLTGPRITATATDLAGNTSEFSPPAVLLAKTNVVTSPLDSGPGTLRQALLDAGPGDTILFDVTAFPPTSPATIGLLSQLPAMSEGRLTIDGSDAGVIVDGSLLSGPAYGLLITSDGNRVLGLQILNFRTGSYGSAGVYIRGRYNVIGGDRTKGMGPTGQGNVISGNDFGIGIHADGVVSYLMSNMIRGNIVGLDASGTQAFGNEIGIQIQEGASYNRVGGDTTGERNIISGNHDRGIQVIGDGVVGNVIAGNYIGTDISGLLALGNRAGVIIESGASSDVVGGELPAERNIISGNKEFGVVISDQNTAHNVIIGNFIGTTAMGTAPLANGMGVLIWSAGFNRVGGSRPGERNLISGNGNGVSLGGLEMSDNLVIGNYIGTDVTGVYSIGNVSGVDINEGTRHNFIGGTTDEERNIISGNSYGVRIENAGIEHNCIAGNYIGTDASGSSPLGNSWAGISLVDDAAHNFVQNNRVAYGARAGVHVDRSSYNTIRRNSIYGNAGKGIEATEGGNNMLPAPVIASLTITGIAGAACPGGTVEVFSDAEDEGRIYEGSVVANASGSFAFDKEGSLAGPRVTATATDAEGNTSEFSPQPAPPAVGLDVSPDGIELRWTQTEPDITRYEVYRYTTPYFMPLPGAFLDNVAPPGLSNEAIYPDDTALDSPLANYYYIVLAVKLGDFKSPVLSRGGAFHFGLRPGG